MELKELKLIPGGYQLQPDAETVYLIAITVVCVVKLH